ncbi:MAG: hypothetical protein M3Y66_08890, partial [Actinomycetota bacterium]|nr:hypothetical protein [Actinomycetota bacterium]
MFPNGSGRDSGVESRPVQPTTQEAVIAAGIKPASWTYAEEFVAEDDVLAAARSRAKEVGVAP